jgi:serine phosphatase RsbU (regulator of sigma subunit)/ketosteroid isomerase-like protein
VSEVQEENKALVRRFVEAQAKGDLDAVKEMMAPDFVARSLLPGQEPDRNGYLRATAEYHAAFSGSRYIIQKQLAEGDEVVTSFTAQLTHERENEGFAPTGREHVLTGIFIHRIAGGRIVEEFAEGTGVLELVEQRLEQEERERERIEQELRVARDIQQASLPKEVPTLEGWEISSYYQPAKEVGGDFYDFHPLSDGRLGVAVGDATGKGVPAALVMASARSMLRAVAQASDSAGEALRRVNDVLATDIPQNMFVTCFYAILEPESASLTYANAGHDLPYLHRNDEAEELRARGMPLGLMAGMEYEEKKIVLQKGDSALFYSDGLVEAHDTKGEMFGFPRLRALMAEHGEEGYLGEFLMEELYSFVGEGWEQEDDITLLTLRRSPSLSRTS